MERPIAAAFVLATFLFVCSAFAGEVDPRFDGKWVGEEKFAWRAGGTTISSRSPKTGIAIAQNGKVLGVLSGWVPGRYEVAAESRGNTLIYRISGKKNSSSQGREDCKLVLSADGKTLEETGHAMIVMGPTHETTRCQVTGTFHRQAK